MIGIGISSNEPKQFLGDATPEHLLGRQERENIVG